MIKHDTVKILNIGYYHLDFKNNYVICLACFQEANSCYWEAAVIAISNDINNRKLSKRFVSFSRESVLFKTQWCFLMIYINTLDYPILLLDEKGEKITQNLKAEILTNRIKIPFGKKEIIRFVNGRFVVVQPFICL